MTHVLLMFTTQKHGIKGEVITHGMTGHNIVCPVRTVVCRVTYLRLCNAPLGTPLYQYYDDSQTPPKAHHVTAKNVTTMLRAGIHLVLVDGVQLDITPDEVSARLLRAGGATALLCANVNPNVIQLLGHWKSDAMIHYLHVLAQPVIGKYATRMFQAGNFTFGPGNQLPPHFAMHVAPNPEDIN